mmetsp:Transcript_2351/g.286  ORF Transcript_2351/g.286 Transcript_2351/m.286 type:complete len:84 (+) Transcript_2351:197-448(+)
MCPHSSCLTSSNVWMSDKHITQDGCSSGVTFLEITIDCFDGNLKSIHEVSCFTALFFFLAFLMHLIITAKPAIIKAAPIAIKM